MRIVNCDTESAVLLTLRRGLALLDAVAERNGSVTAKSLARSLGLQQRTCYHLLRTLRREGYLVRLPNGEFDIGPRRAFVNRLRSTPANGMSSLEQGPGASAPPELGRAVHFMSKHPSELVDIHLETQTTVPEPALSPRQAEVVDLVAKGLTNVEISHKLYIGVDTVKKHLTQALSVTGCRNRTQLALFWLSGRR
ncbi:LuxR C-terminal-related transcriptional regulator [Nocardia sp. CA-107356]|uniref:response regulator transcription factor n=1 Tax=Nocardia sp. CA-107356 TaxID=3239972 RepID=UPI003D8D5020